MTNQSIELFSFRQLLNFPELIPEQLLQGTSVSEESIRSGSLLSHQTQLTLIENFAAHIDSDEWGLLMAREIKFSSFGAYGYSLMSAKNLGVSFEVMCQYAVLTVPYFSFCMTEDRDSGTISFSPTEVLGSIEESMADAVLGMLFRLIRDVFPWQVIDARVGLRGSRRSYHSEAVRDYGENISYGEKSYSLTLPNNILRGDSPLYERDIFSFAQQLCRKRLSEIHYVDNVNCVTLVEESIDEVIDENRRSNAYMALPSIDELATRMKIRSSTLRERLRLRGTNYRTIKQDCRKKWLTILLLEKSISLQRIGDILGFQDGSNFTKSCKIWFGVSPKQYRKILLLEEVEF